MRHPWTGCTGLSPKPFSSSGRGVVGEGGSDRRGLSSPQEDRRDEIQPGRPRLFSSRPQPAPYSFPPFPAFYGLSFSFLFSPALLRFLSSGCPALCCKLRVQMQSQG